MKRSVHSYRSARTVMLCLAALAALCGTAFYGWTQDSGFTLSVDVELVELPVSIVDRDGHPVVGLQREHFTVFEDGVEQEIALFKQEDVPISLGLVIDNSGSMRNKRERVNSAALVFVSESNSEDETFIINFNDEVFLEQEFTGSMGNLVDALDNIDARGETALYDAIYLALEEVEGYGRMNKRALLLISDGEDNRSRYDLDTVMQRLRSSEVSVYAIGLLEENDRSGGLFRKSRSERAKEELEEIVEAAGGQAYFPESLDEVEELCRRIAHELRNHYTIGYNPTNTTLDGSWREVTVEVDAPDGFPRRLEVRTRPGYYAPGASSPGTPGDAP
jgi:Ca-activated chloride channel family protein